MDSTQDAVNVLAARLQRLRPAAIVQLREEPNAFEEDTEHYGHRENERVDMAFFSGLRHTP